MMTQFLNNIYELLLNKVLCSPHLLGKILYRTLLAAHTESLTK